MEGRLADAGAAKMVKKSKRPRTKDSKSQTKRKKRLQHTAFVSVPKLASIDLAWSSGKTLKQNYEEMGVLLDVNKIGKPSSADGKVKGYLVDDLDAIKALPRAPSYVVRSMGVNERDIMRRLLDKHDDDFGAMARDIKINIYQKTAAELRRRAKLYRRLEREGRLAAN